MVNALIGSAPVISPMRMRNACGQYRSILPRVEPVFDGYAFIVGNAPTRVGNEPVFQVLSETDVRTPVRPSPDSEQFRRWEVAGAAHSGWRGQEYRNPISVRDLGAAPVYNCTLPPFSRVPMHHAVAAAYDHGRHQRPAQRRRGLPAARGRAGESERGARVGRRALTGSGRAGVAGPATMPDRPQRAVTRR